MCAGLEAWMWLLPPTGLNAKLQISLRNPVFSITEEINLIKYDSSLEG
jgi:hypothetical protein